MHQGVNHSPFDGEAKEAGDVLLSIFLINLSAQKSLGTLRSVLTSTAGSKLSDQRDVPLKNEVYACST